MVSPKRHLFDRDRDGVKNLRVTPWHISHQYLRRSLMWRYSTSARACLIVTLMKHLWHPTATHSEDIRYWLDVIFNPLHFTTGLSFKTCHKMWVLMTWTSFSRPNVSLLSKWLTIYARITFMFSHFMPSCVAQKDVRVSFRSVSSNPLFCPHSCSIKTRVAIMNFLCENYDT